MSVSVESPNSGDRISRQVSERIFTMLYRLDLSQRQLCTLTGLSSSTMHRRMQQGTSWTIDELITIAPVLGLTLSEIAEGPLPEFEEWASRVRHVGLEPTTR